VKHILDHVVNLLTSLGLEAFLANTLLKGQHVTTIVLNDVVVRTLTKAGVPVQKEPLGLVRKDGKRPDGVTLIPWQYGRCLTSDVTVVDSIASSYISESQRQPAAAAEAATATKESKYEILEQP
jgi:hypothetical protein